MSRAYAGSAPLDGANMSLPSPRQDDKLSVGAALQRRRSVREYASAPIALQAVSDLLWAAQGITSRRGLRTAPSAGALYPLETYVVAGSVADLDPAIYRYSPQQHALTTVVKGDRRQALLAAALGQDWVGQAPCALVICAVFLRTTRKYGDRGVRYAHIEVGHAAQNVYLQAATLGLGTVIVGAFHDDEVRRVIAADPNESPLAIMPIGHV